MQKSIYTWPYLSVWGLKSTSLVCCAFLVNGGLLPAFSPSPPLLFLLLFLSGGLPVSLLDTPRILQLECLACVCALAAAQLPQHCKKRNSTMVEGQHCQIGCQLNSFNTAEAFFGAHLPKDVVKTLIGVLRRTHETTLEERPLRQLQVNGLEHFKDSLRYTVLVLVGWSGSSLDLLPLTP